ncbi:ATP-dependent endonuclease [Methylophilus sp. 14]|uniref:ATP-dependent nuclease n=1 Tax=Methylophilus sp. 14 TaxID=2781019 RepID=UPI00188ED9FF|nr:AAA family ATPase [Methylophilus sp. 14]MBF4989472.1 AAA family ATPase [Methylophilus sp. 14]
MEIKEIIENSRFVVLLGKNGVGKSTLLRKLKNDKNIRYIYPERGGVLRYDLSLEATMDNENVKWASDEGSLNSFPKFKEQSAVQFRRLELLILREIELLEPVRRNLNYTFNSVLDSINNLLSTIKIIRSDETFSVQPKNDSADIPMNGLSSGESELIALAIEVLKFSKLEISDKILLLDEPDVHLHPDLQYKFIEFVENVAKENFKVVISTHSTAIIAGFSSEADLQIVPLKSKDQHNLIPFTRNQICEEVLPIFGTHPLSAAFNKSPIVLVEGEDDKRVLEQVVRSSNGLLKLSPCVVGSVDQMEEWEKWLDQVLPTIYDEVRAFSLRDLDDSPTAEINDSGVVCRSRLNCYAMENLLLCDQSLAANELTPDAFKKRLIDWTKSNVDHKYRANVQDLIDSYDNRRIIKIKNIRNIIVGILTSKPWEVFVANLITEHRLKYDSSPHSLHTYLGQKALKNLFTY